MAEIEAAERHRLIHLTSWERAVCILEQGPIHGTGFRASSTEAYPHFLMAGWHNVNWLHCRANPDMKPSHLAALCSLTTLLGCASSGDRNVVQIEGRSINYGAANQTLWIAADC
ncbi:hypothetical protein [Rhodovulum sulfidophilum]|uniref:hypothetical protein n=1 Tax=Rhodovulum sulfidophilum TaxID=35806 RepID=UPI001F16AB30|nr:hypothetical protein [Rhodovulum sulfidophilum]MCE8420776.1 hypothetical protein [Rhodovulum sulfidophilum]MCE8440859.1 hypothetical protein [Rhodovulum sulfidophilum]MCE8469159.1 hypothetical protein [Rhodovulum sulfidophilum]